MPAAEDTIQGVSVACQAQRGWVTITGRLAGAKWEYPVVELVVLSLEREKLAESMIVDAPREFQMTLHLRDVPVGAPLILRVEVLHGDSSVAVREYSFDYASE
jgi:hypothetical protein